MNEPEIIEYSNIAADLIAEAHSKNSESGVFDQEGLLTGKEIVLDYIRHGECGLAIEHLLYMIHESEISFPQDKLVSLHKVADKLKVANGYATPNT